MPLTLFEEPARPPLIAGPVTLMKLIEADGVGEIEATMRRLRLGPEDFSAETKFNGWLTQAAGGRLYSHRGLELTSKFPDIAAAIAPYTREHLVGELVYWNSDGTMKLQTVGSVATTKNDREAHAKLRALPGHFELVLFDAIALGGYEIARLPTHERYEALLGTVRPEGPLRISQFHPFRDWKQVYEAGIAAGGDGVVVKNLHAPYVWRPLGESAPRPVGAWYKLKPSLSDDFVVFGSSRGPKGKLLAHIGQFHEGQLVDLGTVNNFSSEIEDGVLDRLARGPFVMEIEFTSRFEDTGALQHGRFLAFRDDKDVRDAALPSRYAP